MSNSPYRTRYQPLAERLRVPTTEFGEAVELAAAPVPKVWRLMVWNVPDRLGGLLARLGFRATKKNPAHWWRMFDPAAPADKASAERCKAELQAAGLRGSWQEVDRKAIAPAAKATRHKQFDKHPPRPSREGFGAALNARPIAGSWRRKARRK